MHMNGDRASEVKKGPNWPIFVGVFLISLSVLCLEVILNKMFSLTFWYHFGFIILSVALFGIGFGGLLVFFTNPILKNFKIITIVVIAILLSASIPIVLLEINRIPLEMNVLSDLPVHNNYASKLLAAVNKSGTAEGEKNILRNILKEIGRPPIDNERISRLQKEISESSFEPGQKTILIRLMRQNSQKEIFTLFLMILLLPFIFAGFILSFIFTNFKEHINKIYFFDLVGGGIGCFFALIIFPHNGPLVVSFIISIIGITAASVFAFEKHFIFAVAVFMLAFVDFYFIYPLVKNTDVRVSEEKRILGAYGEKLWSDWDNFAYVAVHKRTSDTWAVTADYSCFTYLYHVKQTNDLSMFKTVLRAHYYPYLIKINPEDVGIIGVGAGKDVLLALAAGAKNIQGAEFNSTIYNLFENIYSKRIGDIGHRTNVHIEFQEGRFFIRSSKQKYDVLVFDNSISQVAVSSGSFTLAESYLFTVQGMMDYITHLKHDGIIYLSNPYVDGPRFVTVLREAFRRLNREDEFSKCILIFNEPGSYHKCKIIVKNSPFTEEEASLMTEYAISIGHGLIYSPYAQTGSKEERLVRSSNIKREYFLSDTEIRPSTDDWPFFSQRVKPGSTVLTRGEYAVKFYYPQPFFLLREVTTQVVFYCALFLVVPLIFLNLRGLRKLHHKFGSIIYFSSIGLGFMLLEIVMMQKYTLILGHPIFAFAVVLSSLLISSGLGSMYSDRFKDPYQAIWLGLGGIALAMAISYLTVMFLENLIIGWPLIVRMITIIILVAECGFFMGFMMPSGIRAITQTDEGRSIPWMWSVNGVFSVLASFVAIYVSIIFGYTLVFIVGLLAYTIGTSAFSIRMILKR